MVVIRILAPFILLMMGGCAPSLEDSRQYNPHYAQGLDLINNKQYTQAIQELQQVSEEDQDYLKAQNAIILARMRLRELDLKEGKNLFEVGEYTKAIELLKKVEPYDPFYPEARQLIQTIQANNLFDQGMAYFTEGDYLKAGHAFRAAINQGTTRNAKEYIDRITEVMINRGIELYRQGALQRAIKEWKKVLSFDPDNTTAKEFIQKAARELRQLEKLKKGE